MNASLQLFVHWFHPDLKPISEVEHFVWLVFVLDFIPFPLSVALCLFLEIWCCLLWEGLVLGVSIVICLLSLSFCFFGVNAVVEELDLVDLQVKNATCISEVSLNRLLLLTFCNRRIKLLDKVLVDHLAVEIIMNGHVVS